MNRQHIQTHAQVVEALSGRTPRQVPQVVYQEGHSSQINPRRNPRSNFRDRANRRRTTGFEEIRQEYYQLHHNKARDEPAEGETQAVNRGQSVDDTQEFFPKPSAFIRAPRRTVPARRLRPSEMEDDELIGGPSSFRTRGSKAADMFQRRRERTDQFILDQENASPQPAAHQAPIQIQLTQVSSPQKQTRRPQPPRQSPQPSVSHHQQPQQHHQYQQQYQQQYQPQPQHRQQQNQYQQHHSQQQQRRPQQQFQQQRSPQQPSHHQQQRPQQPPHHQQHQQQRSQQPLHHQQQRSQQPQQQQNQSYTTVDSKRTRQPLAPKSPRFEPNSPWNDRNMQVGKRFHPNVIPYQDNYNTSPKGWGRSDFGQDNNIKQPYEFTETSQKFNFTPAPRLNHFGSGIKTPQNENYNSRPKSWCDIDFTDQQPPPSRRAYPAPSGRQHSQSSANQFAGHSGWGYGESDEL